MLKIIISILDHISLIKSIISNSVITLWTLKALSWNKTCVISGFRYWKHWWISPIKLRHSTIEVFACQGHQAVATIAMTQRNQTKSTASQSDRAYCRPTQTESTASPLKHSLLQAYPNSCLQRLRLLYGRDEGKQVESLLKVQLCGLGVVGAGEQLSGKSSD